MMSKTMMQELSRLAQAEADHGEYAGCHPVRIGDPYLTYTWMFADQWDKHTPEDQQYLACMASALEEEALKCY